MQVSPFFPVFITLSFSTECGPFGLFYLPYLLELCEERQLKTWKWLTLHPVFSLSEPPVWPDWRLRWRWCRIICPIFHLYTKINVLIKKFFDEKIDYLNYEFEMSQDLQTDVVERIVLSSQVIKYMCFLLFCTKSIAVLFKEFKIWISELWNYFNLTSKMFPAAGLTPALAKSESIRPNFFNVSSTNFSRSSAFPAWQG